MAGLSLLGALLLGLLFGVVPAGHADRLDTARTQVRKLRAELQAATDTEAQTEADLSQLEDAMTLDKLQLSRAKQHLGTADAQLASQAAATYQSGGGLGMLDAVLNGSDQLPDRAEFLMLLLGRQNAAVDDARTARGAFNAAVGGLAADQAAAKKLHDRAKAAADVMRGRFKDAQDLLGRLAGFGSGQATYPASPFGTFNGHLYACPVEPPYTYSDTWGAPRPGGRTHKGVDIMAPNGAKEFAYTAGVIWLEKFEPTGGNDLWIHGDDGNTYFYAHISRYALPMNTRVKAGQLIAYVGQTGDAQFTAPHLHFEVHPGGGDAVDPYPWAKRVC
ncbi:MAG TPA: peptidoglycan DD-metalloendopeptidase family protein [Actinomycetota bacterium]|nr:peptidoglycan DD-metalloendopeptidase family protein [Actinomycetota bacterium]